MLEMRRVESKKWLKVMCAVGFEKLDYEVGCVYEMVTAISTHHLSEATKVAIVDYLLNAFLNYRNINPMWHVRGAKVFAP